MVIMLNKKFPMLLKKKSGYISYDKDSDHWDIIVEGEMVGRADDKRLAEYMFKKFTGAMQSTEMPFTRDEIESYEEKLREAL
jgi:hypothetical protein